MQETPESQAAAKRLIEAKFIVQSLLCRLWEGCGLAGKWVLHTSDFYVPEYDIRDRHKDEDDPQRHTTISGSEGLCYYGESDRPVPDFDSMAYWDNKKAELERKIKEVEAGKVKHEFGPGELMRIMLLEQKQGDTLSQGANGSRETNSIGAWLNGANKAGPLPLSPRGTEGATSGQAQVGNSERKRKRPANHNEELLSGHGPKRSRGQPLPESSTPTQRHVSRQTPSSPPQRVRGHSRTARTAPSTLPWEPSSDVWAMLERHLPVSRGARGSAGFRRGGYSVAGPQARPPTGAVPGTGRHPKRRGTSPGDPPMRRSARIAALPPRTYVYR